MSASTWAAIVKAWSLPPRQAQVVELILQDQCDEMIAQKMGIGVPTVRTYLNRVFQKFRIQRRLSLALIIFADAQRIVGEKPIAHS